MYWIFSRRRQLDKPRETNGQYEEGNSSVPAREAIEVTNSAVRLARERLAKRNGCCKKTAYIIRKPHPDDKPKYDAKPDNVLFRAFRQTNDAGIRQFLFFRWLERAIMAAKRYNDRHMPYAPILSLDDLESTACMGLLRAIDKFDPDKNDSFEGFMQEKIKWTIIDELRIMQDFPRIIAKNRRELKRKLTRLTQELQKKPTLEDIREHLGEEAYRMAADRLFFSNVFNQSLDSGSSKSPSNHPMNLSETVLDDAAELPSKVMGEDMHRLVFKFLSGVHRSVIFQYYFFNMTVTDIASALHISTTQVSDKRQEALAILREHITQQ